MKNFWTALFLLTLIAISLKFIACYYIFLWDNLGAFTITAPTIIAILCFIIKKYYYNRTEETDKLFRSIILFVIPWLISFGVVLMFAMSLLKGYHG